MAARTGFYGLAVSAALVMAAGAMPSGDAMAQTADVAMEADGAPVDTDQAAAPADDVAALEEAAEQPLPRQKPAAVERAVKSDLHQSAVRAVPVTRTPRPIRTSTRAIALPKILGSYR